jgi:hypothetical protein
MENVNLGEVGRGQLTLPWKSNGQTDPRQKVFFRGTQSLYVISWFQLVRARLG